MAVPTVRVLHIENDKARKAIGVYIHPKRVLSSDIASVKHPTSLYAAHSVLGKQSTMSLKVLANLHLREIEEVLRDGIENEIAILCWVPNQIKKEAFHQEALS